jgi:hypothetical protein
MDSAGDTAPDLLGCIALALDGLGGGRILFFLESIAGRGIPAMRLLVALARASTRMFTCASMRGRIVFGGGGLP